MKNIQNYLNASKSQKVKILDMLVTQTGMHRKSIIRRINRPLRVNKRGGSKPKYPPQVVDILKIIWNSMDYICAELLHPQIEDVVQVLFESKRLENFSLELINLVKNIPLGTLKNKLRGINLDQSKGSYYFRRSGNNLKKTVPISTDMNTSTHAGCIEIDFVDHNGGDSSGQFARTMCAVDVFTQFINREAIRGKLEEKVQKVCGNTLNLFPFKPLKVHSDNESALLKSLIYQQANRMDLQISRSRSYQKQDNGHVEQKNGDKIRKLVGYRRYDSLEHENLLNQIYHIDDLFQNHFIPSMRLKEKLYDENGKLLRKIYDKAQTPYQRVLADVTIAEENKQSMKDLHKVLNPLELKEQRDKLIRKLRSF